MTRTVKAFLAALALAVALVGTVAGPAAAQSYTGSSVAVSSNNVTCGATLTGTGTGWAPGIPVTLTVASTPVTLPPVTPDATGSFTVEFASPLDPGPHTLTATQVVEGVTITRVSEFTCVEAQSGSVTQPVTPAGALPFTGGDSTPILQVGILLLAAGALIALVARKRRHA
ncbi:MAG: LPXTG cell wall anchor domain-containing protein [Acidimicrobiales bacterium]|jgi:LPXTG-motif cell wall-anchored protein|nr:LPXTG cell wall anchor domain-containing protein [Acidimicrobiales bacterium]